MPILTDGQPHTISLDVVSAEDNHAINQNWFVSGNLQVITDPSGRPTKGRITSIDAPPFATTKTTGVVGANGDVNVTVSASRIIRIEAQIIAGSGAVTEVVWSQQLEYSNTQNFLDNTFVQLVSQTATGSFLSTHNGVTTLQDDFSYPLDINITNLVPNGSSCK